MVLIQMEATAEISARAQEASNISASRAENELLRLPPRKDEI